MKRKIVIASSAMLMAIAALAQSGSTASSNKDKSCSAVCTTKGHCDKTCCSKDNCDKSKCSHAGSQTKDGHSSK